MIRILIADDHTIVREALASLLDGEPDMTVVAQVPSGEGVADLARRSGAGVALLDVRMPGTDGLDAAEALAGAAPGGVAVVMLSADGRPGHLRRALAAGVLGFVSKHCPAERLLEAVRTAHAGGRYLDPGLAAEAVTAQRCPLTPRELRALQVAQHGASTDELARALGVRPRSARNLLTAAVGAIGAGSTVAAVRAAREAGWL